MVEGEIIASREEIASALDWWALAGLGVLVDEAPRDWLAPPPRKAPAAPTAEPASAPAASAPAPLPDDLAAFHAWLTSGEVLPGSPPPRRRVAPSGDPAAGLMVIADMPDPGEEGGALFSGETARLFDAMLAAIGRTRAQVYMASLSPWRMPGGRIADSAAEPLVRAMRRHVALIRPCAVLLLGDESSRWLLDSSPTAPKGLQTLNHDRGTVSAIAAVHPRMLRRHPAAKAGAWTALRLLNGVLAQ